MAKQISSAEFFGKHNRAFIKFGDMFTKKLTDEQLISALAEKDLEKLAKVFRLVFEMLDENERGGQDKLTELIGAYRETDGEEDSGQ